MLLDTHFLPSSFQPPSSHLPNVSFNFSFNCSKGVRDYRQRTRIEFSRGWNHEDNLITQWYHLQPNSKFQSIEYRKERGGVRHEYILALLQDNDGNRVEAYCRLERVADPTRRMDAIGAGGTAAFDFVQTIDPSDPESSAQIEADSESEILARITFPRMFDLIDIIAICYGIYIHPRAKRYTIQQFNCFFFSWTVIMCLARRAVDWERVICNKMDEIQRAVIKHVENLRSSQTFTAWSLLFRVHDSSDTQKQRDVTDRFLHEISSGHFLEMAGRLLGSLLWYDQDPRCFRPALANCLDKAVNEAADPLLDDLNLRDETVNSRCIPEPLSGINYVNFGAFLSKNHILGCYNPKVNDPAY